jgi:hypothetical protein
VAAVGPVALEPELVWLFQPLEAMEMEITRLLLGLVGLLVRQADHHPEEMVLILCFQP